MCKPGYALVGFSCVVNNCLLNPCQNGGTCNNTAAFPFYNCSCPITYGGYNCTIFNNQQFYITGKTTGHLYHVNGFGKLNTVLSSGLSNSPYFLTSDSSSNLYITQYTGASIYTVNATTGFISTMYTGSGVTSIRSIDAESLSFIGSGGFGFLSCLAGGSNAGLDQITTSGTLYQSPYPSTITSCYGSVTLSTTNVYYTTSNGVWVFGKIGSTPLSPGQVCTVGTSLSKIVIGDNQALYVLDSATGTIYQIPFSTGTPAIFLTGNYTDILYDGTSNLIYATASTGSGPYTSYLYSITLSGNVTIIYSGSVQFSGLTLIYSNSVIP